MQMQRDPILDKVNLPPTDETYRILDNGRSKIILSVLDTPVTLGENTTLGNDFSAYEYFMIFAESIYISGTIRANNLVLSTHFLAGKDAVIDVSGHHGFQEEKPAQGSTPGISGENGSNGGNVSIYIGNQTQENMPVTIIARGGDGGDGQEGAPSLTETGCYTSKGGNGGNGGNGGQVHFIVTTLKMRIIQELKTAEQNNDYPSMRKTLQLIANLNNEFTSATEELIFQLANQISLVLPKSSLSKQLQMIFDTLDEMKLETSLPILSSAVHEMVLTLGEESLFQKRLWEHAPNIQGGNHGIYGMGNPPGKNGSQGNPGKVSITFTGTWNNNYCNDTIPCLHPEHCRMLFQKAQQFFYLADKTSHPENAAKAASLFLRLIPLADDDASTVNYSAETERLLDTRNSHSTFLTIARQADARYLKLCSGLDYYGMSPIYAPMGSFSFYGSQLPSWLDDLSSIETEYSQYKDLEKEQFHQVQALKSARNEATYTRIKAQQQLKVIQSESVALASDIAICTRMASDGKNKLEKLIKKFRALIDHAFGYTFDDFLNALSLCGFAPNSPLIVGSQIGDLISKGSSVIKTADGMGYKKDYVVHRYEICNATFSGLKEGYQALENGLLTLDDPGADKLLATEEELLGLLEQFYQNFPEELAELKQTFENYANLILHRNNSVIRYNENLLSILDAQIEIENQKEKAQELTDEILENWNQSLSFLSSYMSNLYYSSRDQAALVLYRAEKAYQYWALKPDSIIGQVLGDAEFSSITSNSLRKAYRSLLEAYNNSIEERGTIAQIFPSPTAGIAVLEYDFVKYKKERYIERLKENKELTFELTPARPNTKIVENPFAGKADVRIASVKVWLDGVSTENDRLQIQIIHGGVETILTPDNIEYKFSHSPITILFEYQISTQNVLINGQLSPDIHEDIYALHSPFTYWNMIISEQLNPGLNLENLENIRIEFTGCFRPFPVT
ncbi:MAG: hypothetical protein ACLRPH_06800 [Ruminococcus sp.]